MSIVSATKYYSGHSDVMGGSLAVSKSVFKKVMRAQNMTGLRLSPDDAYFIMRGIRTLDVRLEKHQDNANKLAKFLSKKKNIEVLYPYKKNTKNYKLWKKYYSGASGLMGLKITVKNKKSVDKFVNSLNLFGHGYSWGGFESLALHQEINEQGKRHYLNLNKNEYIVRLHVGLEDPKDLINDIKKSLKFFNMNNEKFISNRLALTTLIAACLVVLISLSVRQVFGMFFMDFNIDLGISNTEFGLAIGIQMLGWGLSGPIFGAIADKYGGHKAIMLAFIFYILGVYFLYAGPNTGLYFQISLGLLIGIGCGGTAISIPMSIVGKHFPLSNRTIAMSLVTATESFGYFISPLFTNYSLENNGWIDTLLFFIFLCVGFLIAYFVRSPNEETNSGNSNEIKQTTLQALNEAFSNKVIYY